MHIHQSICSVLVAATTVLCLASSAAGGIMQRVETIQGTNPLIDPAAPEGSSIDSDITDEVAAGLLDSSQLTVFGLTSADITTDILAQIDGTIRFGFYNAASAASRFGNVGLASNMISEVSSGEFNAARVLIVSDEFSNPFGVPQTVTANFIIDGGELQVFGADVHADYRLVVGAKNLGNVPMSSSLLELQSLIFLADNPFFMDATFASQGRLETSFSGNTTFTTYSIPFATKVSDIGTTFDAASRSVDIPLSFQSLNLGTVLPGDRMLLFYSLYLETGVNFTGGGSAQFSDPLSLSSNIAFPTLSFQPVSGSVPEPSTFLCFSVSAMCFALWKSRTGRSVKSPDSKLPYA